MALTYQISGIILKSSRLREADRLLTLLSPERGLMKIIAPGVDKAQSPLRGRCELFRINQFFLSRGKSLDRILQVETLGVYSGLTQSVAKLAAGQYLAQIVLTLAITEQPQPELYSLLNEHLSRLVALEPEQGFHGPLAQALFHFLALGGVAPQVYHCCLTQKPIRPNFEHHRWQTGFCCQQGGLVPLTSLGQDIKTHKLQRRLNAIELSLLQHLAGPVLPQPEKILPPQVFKSFRLWDWVRLEHLLRDYAQYHLGQTFRAAVLVDDLAELAF